MTRARDDEHGYIVLTAIALMTAMLVIGIALLKIVDTQAKQTRVERVRESSFNLAEGLLYAEAQVLQTNWPTRPQCTGNANGCGYTTQNITNPVTSLGNVTCDSTSGANPTNQCPDTSQLIGANLPFSNVDITSQAVRWSIYVRDDRGGTKTCNPIYTKSGSGTVANPCNPNPPSPNVDATVCTDNNGQPTICTWDANPESTETPKADRKMWVRVDVTVRGRTRSLVALLQLENFALPFPNKALVAGNVTFSNNGSKPIVNSGASSVTVRCAPTPRGQLNTSINAGVGLVVVKNPVGTFGAGDYVIDPGSGVGEKVTALSASPDVSGNIVLTLKNNTVNPHNSNVPVEAAPSANPPQGCENWDNSKPELVPDQYRYVNDPNFQPTALTQAQLDLITGTNVTTYTSCPDPKDPTQWAGRVVIDVPNTLCTLNPNGNSTINSASTPGFIIILHGYLAILSNTVYYGVVYDANQDPGSCALTCPNGFNGLYVLAVTGGSSVVGAVSVDGQGQVLLGQSSNSQNSPPTLLYDPNAILSIGAAGAAGLVQNSWRELTVGQ